MTECFICKTTEPEGQFNFVNDKPLCSLDCYAEYMEKQPQDAISEPEDVCLNCGFIYESRREHDCERQITQI